MGKEYFYIVAGIKLWNKQVFDNWICKLPGKWMFADNKVSLEHCLVSGHPEFIFFLHWSDWVPSEMIENYNCVCFHMTDVPYGRGGSPLQNLIIRGHTRTQLTALKMVKEFDAGPVYIKKDLSLEGNAEEIYIRSSRLSAGIIKEIIEKNIEPVQQHGECVVFNRRKHSDSEIKDCDNLEDLYDHIRMLDAEGYPKAYIKHGKFKLELLQANYYHDKIKCSVIITKENETEN